MRQKVRRFLPALYLMLGLLATGCYTQFATLEQKALSPDGVETVIDSTGKKVTAVRRVDTVPTIDRETCIWERDLMGFPTLHCYKGYYPSQWYLYNFSPWWYHTDEYLYSAGRCPPFYYYDNNCGCCRYYLNNPDALRNRPASVDSPVQANSAPATGKVSSDSQNNNVNITTGSHTVFYSGQHVSSGLPSGSRLLPAGAPASPSTAARPDTAARKNDSASTNMQQPSGGTGSDTAKSNASASTQQQNSGQDTVRVPPARPQLHRSLRAR